MHSFRDQSGRAESVAVQVNHYTHIWQLFGSRSGAGN